MWPLKCDMGVGHPRMAAGGEGHQPESLRVAQGMERGAAIGWPGALSFLHGHPSLGASQALGKLCLPLVPSPAPEGPLTREMRLERVRASVISTLSSGRATGRSSLL